jgi:hypothetical protein
MSGVRAFISKQVGKKTAKQPNRKKRSKKWVSFFEELCFWGVLFILLMFIALIYSSSFFITRSRIISIASCCYFSPELERREFIHLYFALSV